jgi:hypothetical protein
MEWRCGLSAVDNLLCKHEALSSNPQAHPSPQKIQNTEESVV